MTTVYVEVDSVIDSVAWCGVGQQLHTVSHHADNPASTLACHTFWGCFIKPACLMVATAVKLNKSQPVNGFDSSAISSAIISLWARTDSMLSVPCYLGVTQHWFSLQCWDGSALPPVVLRTGTAKEEVDCRATRDFEVQRRLPCSGLGAAETGTP